MTDQFLFDEAVWNQLNSRITEDEYWSGALSYLQRRWGKATNASELMHGLANADGDGLIGWSAELEGKGLPWSRSHPLTIPLRTITGEIVSCVRRYTGFGDPKNGRPKAMQLSSRATGLEKGGNVPLYLGDPRRAVAETLGQRSDGSGLKPLIIVEGELDYLLFAGLVAVGALEAGVLGIAGGAGNQPKWWNQLQLALYAAHDDWRNVRVIMAVDNDDAGDRYHETGLVVFSEADRVLYPRGQDATDVVYEWGPSSLLSLVRTRESGISRWWILDEGDGAYHNGVEWLTCNKTALYTHMNRAGVEKPQKFCIPVARNLAFEPRSESRVLWEHTPRLNTYRPLTLQGNPELDWEPIRRLLLHVCGGDPDALEWWLDWWAMPVQSMHAGDGPFRTGVGVIAYGAQGSGKGMVGRLARRIYDRYWLVLSQDSLEDKFAPGDLERALFVHADEVIPRQARGRARVEGMLKTWVTEDVMQVRGMYASSKQTPPWFNLFVTSNDPSPLRVEHWDRRWTFFEQMTTLLEGVGQELRDELIAQDVRGWPMADGFLAHLLERPGPREQLTRKRKMNAFENAARQRQLRLFVPSEEAFLAELLDAGLHAVSRDWLEDQARRNGGQSLPKHCWVKLDARDPSVCGVHWRTLSQVYDAWCKSRRLYSVDLPLLQETVRRKLPRVDVRRLRIDQTQLWGVYGLPFETAPESTPVETALPDATW